MKRHSAAALTTAVLLLALSGCTASGGVNNAADKEPAAKSKTAAAAKVGQPITVKGNTGTKVTIVVMKVVDPVRATDGFSVPEAGQRFLAVQFKITNVGKVPYDDSPSNGAKIVDAKGQQFTADFAASKISAGPVFPAAVKIPPGGSALGFLVFQAPTTSKVAKVQFGADSGFGETGEWTA